MSHKIAHIPLDFAGTASMCGAERGHPWMLAINLVQRNDANAAHIWPDPHIPWHKPPSKWRREILLPDNIEAESAGPIRSETRVTLVAAIARGRRWLKE